MTDEAKATTDLAVHEAPAATMALPSEHELGRMERIANALAASNIVPTAYRRKPHDILAATLAGRELGLAPMSALQRIFVVDGRPTLSAEGMVALVTSAGHELWFDESSDDKRAIVHGQRKGSEHIHTMTFTIEEARAAGLVNKANWKSYPKAMLRARATSALCRIAFADVLAGYAYTPEEMGAAVDEEGAVIEAQVVDNVSRGNTTEQGEAANWLDALIDQYTWDVVREHAQTLADEHNVGAVVEQPDNLRGLNASWQAMLRERLAKVAQDVSAASDGANDVVDAEVVEDTTIEAPATSDIADRTCPFCASPCERREKKKGAKVTKWWQCTNPDCDAGDKGMPWTSFHNDPWKPGGQIETEIAPKPSGEVGNHAVTGSAEQRNGEPVPHPTDTVVEGGDEGTTLRPEAVADPNGQQALVN